ncbi:secreted protein [Rhodopirellula maiorica SM1]|uniref:Secreted protein n=1 Tax=Rhodopirellula maiorica SM1 TaxID=1265738 RepID=M5REH5_9BACT|nr:hypothetical protein [Rhodopirellula maiorica]EMI17858.1 secreted protein [Rhodopirellula maiorica SM1]
MLKRTPAALAAIAMVCSATVVTRVHAESDLDVLLDSLSFADAPMVGDDSVMDRPAHLVSDVGSEQDAVESLSDRKSPTPIADPAESDQLQPAPLIPEPVRDPLRREPSVAESTSPMLPEPANIPAPIIAADQPPMDYGMIESDADCACGHHGCQNGCASRTACEPAYICKPHEVPVLPNSTLRQYFRSDPCSVHLWDGYALERQQHCDKHHKHIHNRCECNNRGQCESCVLGKRNLAARPHCDAGCDGAHR